jgi:hypothetical protein
MTLTFESGNRDCTYYNIQTKGRIGCSLGYIPTIIAKLERANFLWRYPWLIIVLDLSARQVTLRVPTTSTQKSKGFLETVIPLWAFLRVDISQVVEEYMRPFAVRLAKVWNLPNTAEAIESRADREINRTACKEDYSQTDFELQLRGRLLDRLLMSVPVEKDYNRAYTIDDDRQIEALKIMDECRAGDYSNFPSLTKAELWQVASIWLPFEFRLTHDEYKVWENGHQKM